MSKISLEMNTSKNEENLEHGREDEEVANINEQRNCQLNPDDGEPRFKIIKLESPVIDLTLSPPYSSYEFAEVLKQQWLKASKEDYKDFATDVEIFIDPFQICLLPNLLKNKDSCKLLVKEIVENVSWSRKQMDLYEFYQSRDLSNMIESCLLANFLQMLRRSVRPWLEKVTNLKLDYVSASCSMYTCSDYLLVHDDLIKDRQIAFVYYLSPWEENEIWSEEQGGCLEIFASDENSLPQFPVQRKISPKNNQFIFFKVGSKSFHQVGEVTTFDYPRLTINGWFHGATNDDLVEEDIRPLNKIQFKPPLDRSSVSISDLLNEVYLKPTTKRSIQKRIEDNSEICLFEFFRREFYILVLNQLIDDDSLTWLRKGPANVQNYEVLDLSQCSGAIEKLVHSFTNRHMFSLLREITDLDLSGPNISNPSFYLEVQKWSHGDYTILEDGVICESNTLDLIYYMNAADGAAVITYLSPDIQRPDSTVKNTTSHSDTDSLEGHCFEEDDDSVLLTISPADNALNVVYRLKGTTKFTKYISHNVPMDRGPVFVIACSYRE